MLTMDGTTRMEVIRAIHALIKQFGIEVEIRAMLAKYEDVP